MTGYQVIYPEQWVPLRRSIPLGLQHVIAMFGATVLAPLLMGFDPNLAVLFSGIGTLIFMAIVRGKVPSYLGSSFAFIGPVIAAQAFGGVPAALGAIAVTGIVYALVGAAVTTGLGTRIIRILMPPQVTAAVVCIIGIGLAPIAWSSASADWSLALITMSTAIIFAVATRGFTKLIPVLMGVIVGYAVALVNGQVNLDAVNSATWFGWPNFVTPTFSLQAITLVLPVVVMLVAENVGHVKAISAYMNRDLDRHIGPAFIGDGVATAVSASFGGTGQTTYAENIGVMSITKVYSRYPLIVAALTAISLGFIPKFGALVQSIPVPVMGGITLVLFGMIAGASTKVISSSKEDWGRIETFGVFGVSVAVCAALIAVFNTNAALNNALELTIPLPTTIDLGPVQLDAIGAATFFAVGMNLAIVLLQKLSPFAEKEGSPVEAVSGSVPTETAQAS